MNIQKELEYLLNHHWISKEENQEMYYQIKSKISKIIEFVTNKLGSKIIVNQDIIKIEKIPSRVNEAMALKEFDNVIDYVLFMFLLIFLEDKVKGDQFILSNLTTYINDSSTTLDIKEKPNWNLYSHRKSLVKILKYASEISILKIKDGNANKFADDMQTEVLYETLGTSYHYVRRFKKAMDNSYIGIFKIINYDFDNALVEIEDIINGKRFEIVDISLSSGINAKNVYIYNRIITYEDISFGTGLNISFPLDDFEINNYIKEYSDKKQTEFIRCLDLFHLSKNSRILMSVGNIK